MPVNTVGPVPGGSGGRPASARGEGWPTSAGGAGWPVLGPEVHAWHVRLDLPDAQVGALARTLSADEVERAGRFHFARDERRFVVAHGALRSILGRYTGTAPSAVRLETNAWGKPALACGTGGAGQAGPWFNASHSGDRALVALTARGEVGVDIERIRPLPDAAGLAAQVFSPAERSALLAVPEGARLEAFYTAWTRKEAVIKALGEGLSFPLAEFDVSLVPGEPFQLLAMRAARGAADWSLHVLEPGRGYVAALAVRGRVAGLRILSWRLDGAGG